MSTPRRNSYTVRFKVSVVEWQRKNEASIHKTAKHFTIDRKRVCKWCQKYSPLKGQTCGALGKRRRLCCGKPLSVELELMWAGHRKGGRNRERKCHIPRISPPLRFVLRLRLQKGGRICGTLWYKVASFSETKLGEAWDKVKGVLHKTKSMQYNCNLGGCM